MKAYYAYDVASGCIVGYAYNRLKTADLFLDCVRNMFQTIERNGWYMPAQVEVEHHLVNNFADGLMKAGVVFLLSAGVIRVTRRRNVRSTGTVLKSTV